MTDATPARPLWKKLIFPACLTLVTIAGIIGCMIAMRDPQEHGHGLLGKLLFQKTDAYNFKLTGHDGRPVELAQFRGKAVMFSFGFASCPNICPATLSHFAAIRKALPGAGHDRVQFLFISVDPERDTRERLAEYVPFFDPSFLGLTGTPEELAQVAYQYNASFKKGKASKGNPKDYFVDHTADAFLIDPEGKWVMSYAFEDLSKTGEIARDIARLTERQPVKTAPPRD